MKSQPSNAVLEDVGDLDCFVTDLKGGWIYGCVWIAVSDVSRWLTLLEPTRFASDTPVHMEKSVAIAFVGSHCSHYG